MHVVKQSECMTQPSLINLHPNEYSQLFHCYPFMIKLNLLEVAILLRAYLIKYVFQRKSPNKV